MRKGDQLFLLKYFFNVLNGIFLALGLLLAAFGLWILLGSNLFFTLLYDELSLASFSHLLLVTGSVVVFTGLLGCLGSLHEIRCLLAMYMTLLVLLLGLQSTILVLLHTKQEMILTLWKTRLDELISTYGNTDLPEQERQWEILDDFQRAEHCCGRHNVTDWTWNRHTDHAKQVPCSCTTRKTRQWFCEALANSIYIRGCEEGTKMWFEKNMWVSVSMNSGLLSVEALQFLIAVLLFRLAKKAQVLPKN